MSKNYRLYTFINFYLSQIQQGIQTAHIVHELFMKYRVMSSAAPGRLDEWATNHKTIIVLNGGEGRSIAEMLEVTKPLAAKMDLPFADFHEDEGLGNIRTGFGIVLPEEIYDAKYEQFDTVNKLNRRYAWVPVVPDATAHFYYEDTVEYNFLQLLKQKRLA